MKFAPRLGILALGVLAAPAVAPAAETVATPRFDQVELNGGGRVTVRHGAQQRVTLLSGSSTVSRLRVRNGRLEIDVCDGNCPRDYKLDVEVVTPRIEGVAINGGGRIAVGSGFPQQNALAASIRGGGAIDATGVTARAVAASIQGGGEVRVDASETLTAAINGGGKVLYEGDPRTNVAINGGGTVNRLR